MSTSDRSLRQPEQDDLELASFSSANPRVNSGTRF